MIIAYLIFSNNKIYAYTDNKKFYKTFMRERRGLFETEIVEIEDIQEDHKMYQLKLEYYDVFGTLLTEIEYMKVMDIAGDRLWAMVGAREFLESEILPFIKFDNEEIFTITKFFEYLVMMEEDVSCEYESEVYLDDYFDIKSIITTLFMKHEPNTH